MWYMWIFLENGKMPVIMQHINERHHEIEWMIPEPQRDGIWYYVVSPPNDLVSLEL